MPSHGSLAKSGKVRSQQPKQWDKLGHKNKKGVLQRHYKKHRIPRVSNRRRFEKRVLLERESGQNWLRTQERSSRYFER